MFTLLLRKILSKYIEVKRLRYETGKAFTSPQIIKRKINNPMLK